MKYLCIVYIDPEIFGALSPQGLAALDEASLAFDEELHQAGQLSWPRHSSRSRRRRRSASGMAACRRRTVRLRRRPSTSGASCTSRLAI